MNGTINENGSLKIFKRNLNTNKNIISKFEKGNNTITYIRKEIIQQTEKYYQDRI